MKSVSIMLNMAESVKQFVNITTKYDYDMALRSGKFVVDPKSILGIFSLDLGHPVTLEIMQDECDDILNDLETFIAQ